MPHKHARTSIKMIEIRKSVSKIESAVKASMLDLKNSFSGQKVLSNRKMISVRYSNRISTDEEHFLVLCTLYNYGVRTGLKIV